MELYYLQFAVLCWRQWKKLDTFLFLFSELEKAPAVLQTAECRESFGI